LRVQTCTVVAAALLFIAPAFADQSARPTAILPAQFGGWKMAGAPRISSDPVAADPANAALLKEYGFIGFESATYTFDDGRKLTIKAALFPDATGAYGAFTYYHSPAMLDEKIGNQGASLNEHVLFYRGEVLVDAVFQKLSAMSAAELRELASQLPLPTGGAQNLASFLSYFPRETGKPPAIKYVLGPVGLQKINAPIPAELVDFSNGTEVATATYHAGGGDTTLMLVSYQTPLMAGNHLRSLEAAEQQNARQPGSVPALASGPLYAKRTGPMMVVAVGPETAARDLLASVNYEANVTWNEANPFDKHNNIGTIVVTALLFSGIVAVLALVAGLAFGGVRLLFRKLLPNTSLGQPDEAEFISLHLEEGGPAPTDAKVS
jgi:hypothetical protein